MNAASDLTYHWHIYRTCHNTAHGDRPGHRKSQDSQRTGRWSVRPVGAAGEMLTWLGSGWDWAALCFCLLAAGWTYARRMRKQSVSVEWARLYPQNQCLKRELLMYLTRRKVPGVWQFTLGLSSLSPIWHPTDFLTKNNYAPVLWEQVRRSGLAGSWAASLPI